MDDSSASKSSVGRLFGLARRASDVASRLPGADIVRAGMEEAESLVLAELRRRMQRVEDAPDSDATDLVVADRYTLHDFDDRDSPAARVRRRLEAAQRQSPDAAEAELHHWILDQLVTDELRILAAMSDGEPHPLLHVASGPRLGPATRREVENFSTVGKVAMVKLVDRVPWYLGHMRSLDLLVVGPEDDQFDVQYQLLETDASVRALVRRIDAHAARSARFQRHIIRLSPFGQRLWIACQPG